VDYREVPGPDAVVLVGDVAVVGVAVLINPGLRPAKLDWGDSLGVVGGVADRL
jgi:hypothetical protein